MTTFAELGVPVPLFLADATLADGLREAGMCATCGRRGPCLPLGDLRVDVRGALTGPAAGAVRHGVPVRLHGCVACLRAGRWVQAHDTEIGPIGRSGRDHGSAAAGEYHELLRTPRYAAFQGERWLFCHDLPMVYLGEWGRAEFDAERPGAGRQLFTEIVTDVDPDQIGAAWEHGLAPGYDGRPGLRVYTFRCQTCGCLRTHSDCD